jgi:ferredoxin
LNGLLAFTIKILGPDGRVFSCRTDQTLLDGAMQSGVAVPYGCGVGKCAICKVRVVDGQFRRLKTPVNERRAKPDILYVCCTQPLSDLVLTYSSLQRPK